MSHVFVETLERELALRKNAYSKAVREGRMRPETARAEYDRMQAVLDFIRALELRYDGEDRYGETPEPHPAVLQAMAQGDGEARRLWNAWKRQEPARRAA